MKYRYTDTDLINAVATSISLREVLTKLSIVPAGGNYKTIRERITVLNISTVHFSGQAWNKGKTLGPKRNIEDYLSNKVSIQPYKLKNILLRYKYLSPICSSCALTMWLGKTIPLELHHKDGNPHNNALENLCLVCPNCHALTPNYRGKNITPR